MSEQITQSELREGIEQIGTAFEEFKTTNNQRLKELEKKGTADPLTEEKQKKIEEHLDNWEDFNQKCTKAFLEQKTVGEKVDRIETMMNRPDSGFNTSQIDDVKKAYEAYKARGYGR